MRPFEFSVLRLVDMCHLFEQWIQCMQGILSNVWHVKHCSTEEKRRKFFMSTLSKHMSRHCFPVENSIQNSNHIGIRVDFHFESIFCVYKAIIWELKEHRTLILICPTLALAFKLSLFVSVIVINQLRVTHTYRGVVCFRNGKIPRFSVESEVHPNSTPKTIRTSSIHIHNLQISKLSSFDHRNTHTQR